MGKDCCGKGKRHEQSSGQVREKNCGQMGALATIMANNAVKGKFAEMCARYGVDIKEMIPHQHNSNGLAERNNRTLHKSLWSYINKEQDDWDQLLPGIQFAMNILNAKAHKKSPYYAVTGRELVMPAERLYNKKPTAEFESMDVSGGESAPEPDVVMDSDKDFEKSPQWRFEERTSLV